MKKYIQSISSNVDSPVEVTIYLHPIIHVGSKIFEQVSKSAVNGSCAGKKNKAYTHIKPEQIINGSLSEYGEELENPISDEWDSLVNDFKWYVEEFGFKIIKITRSDESKKSEYVLQYSIDNKTYGTLIYNLKISENPFDATFPEAYKDIALEYLQMQKVLDGSAAKVGIDFQVEKVIVDSVKYDTLENAYTGLDNVIARIKKQIRNKI